MLKLNRLFYASDEEQVFHDCIEPTKEKRDFLEQCKNDIRDYLRLRIQHVTKTALGMPESVTPRFRTQGSWSYKTCIEPAFHPPQEMDWDFGIYLPVSIWEENGPPHEMAKKYFDLVESLLKDLCTKKGWKLNSGKDTCIRVQVVNWAHIDIPLYAAPKHKFSQIFERAAMAASNRSFTALNGFSLIAEDTDFAELREQTWEDLDDIVMATRTGTWKASDPEAVSRWFRDRVAEHGEQLRRVNRYLKAWRDFHWSEGGGPTSIALMIATGQAFKPQRHRDDLALENSISHLSEVIQGEIRETAIDDGAEDFNRLTEAERIIVAKKASDLVSALLAARSSADHMKQEVIHILQQQFGRRIPSRHDLVEIDNGLESVRTTVAQRVPHPVVLATNAG
jgi:hypothetical protein